MSATEPAWCRTVSSQFRCSLCIAYLLTSSVLPNIALALPADEIELSPTSNDLGEGAPARRGAAVSLFSTFGGVDPGPNETITSQLFTDFYADPPNNLVNFFTIAADDFTVPPDTFWSIETIRNLGSYSFGMPAPGGPLDSVNIYILGDAGGVPDTTDLSAGSLYAYEGVPYVDEGIGDLRVDLMPPAQLTEGTYWVAIQGVMAGSPTGQYLWTTSASAPNSGTSTGYESVWMDNALYVPPFEMDCLGAWMPRVSVCGITRSPDPSPPAELDMVFELLGTAGQVLNVDTGEVFTDITSGIDDADTLDGHTLQIGPATFAESVFLNKRVNLVGSGSGVGGTVVDGRIRLGASGLSEADPIRIQDLRVTGAQSGFRIDMPARFLLLEDVAAVDNESWGFHITLQDEGPVQNLTIVDSLFSGNLAGIRTSSDAVVEDVQIINTQILDNERFGIGLAGLATVNEAMTRRWSITGGEVSGNGATSDAFGGGIVIWTSGPTSEVVDFLVDGVGFRNNGGPADEGAGVKIWASPDTLLQNIEIANSLFVEDAEPGVQREAIWLAYRNGLVEPEACDIRLIDNLFQDLQVGVSGRFQLATDGTIPGAYIRGNGLDNVGLYLEDAESLACGEGVADIPTSSPWGLILLMLALASAAFSVIRRK